MSCTSTTSCIAVASGTPNPETFAEQWNGTSWTIQPINNPGYQLLSAVSCTSGTACAAVGQSFVTSDGDEAPFAEGHS